MCVNALCSEVTIQYTYNIPNYTYAYSLCTYFICIYVCKNYIEIINEPYPDNDRVRRGAHVREREYTTPLSGYTCSSVLQHNNNTSVTKHVPTKQASRSEMPTIFGTLRI